MKADPVLADPGSLIGHPCGCETWTQGDAFVIKPCAPDCELYARVRAMTAERGNPLQYQIRTGEG